MKRTRTITTLVGALLLSGCAGMSHDQKHAQKMRTWVGSPESELVTHK